jgi:hypothetical protein
VEARADSKKSMARPAPAARAEHIHIEAEPEAQPIPVKSPRRKVRTSYSLRSSLRGCETHVSILDEHYLSVRSVRQGVQKSYDFDLRFATPKPLLVRHVSWFWLALALSFAALGAGAIWSMTSRGDAMSSQLLSPIFVASILTLLAAAGALFMFLRRTTESLEFVSAHGGATLLSVTGGIGSVRAGRKFFVELIKSINAAKAARPQARPQLLRDEMREHHRLRELGVLSEEHYAASKARILAAH